MRRAAWVICMALCAFAQTSRDAYRAAYREWREADPALERDAGAPGAELTARAAKVASGAAQYGSARAAFLQQWAADEAPKLVWLGTPPDAPSAMILESASTVIAAESRAVRRMMDTYASDPDPAIRELRAMLARESGAADALASAIEKRKSAAEAVIAANAAAAESQLKVAAQVQAVAADGNQLVEDSSQEMAAWAQYYALLAEASRAASPPPAPVAPTPSAPAPLPAPATPTIPLVRYTGEWTFPPLGMYHGAQPISVNLVVREENGHASGTFVARFKLAPGATGDPVVKFDFAGEFKSARTQLFTLTTSDGAKGTVELIPGPAFNLLEVNFQTEAKPGKIRQGNFVLLKQ
jgi:hypothetical protein